MEKILNYINGELIGPANDIFFNNINPATGAVLNEVPESNEIDLDLAIKASEDAFSHWSQLSGQQRSVYLMRISTIIDQKLNELARAESLDTGKPLSLAKAVDIPRAASNFEFFAHAASQFSSESHGMSHAINYTLRKPIGTVGCISPWNLPLYLFSWKIAPALAAGNCVIAKPSELTPYTAYLLSRICIEAGLPPGVLNILHGHGASIGNQIVENTSIKAISFTGGTATGQKIASISAPMFRKVSLELGGKNAALVFNDCNLNKTVKELVRASFSNQGEICLCVSRILVEKEIYEEFKSKFIYEVEKLIVGDPLEATTDFGAIVSESHYLKIQHYIKSAIREGGKLLTGDKAIPLNRENLAGFYLRPHVFENLTNEATVNQEEVFGPLVTLIPFKGDKEAVKITNDSKYGLACTIWTENLSRAHALSAQIQTGIVWVNCWMLRDLRTPFGGTKQSGLGREGGLEAMRFFTESTNICISF